MYSYQPKENIVVENHTAILVDYGLSFCVAESNNTEQCDFYKSPELKDPQKNILQEPTQESDVYAMAFAFYEVCIVCFCVQRLPSKASTLQILVEQAPTEGNLKRGQLQYPGSIWLQHDLQLGVKRGLQILSLLWSTLSDCWSKCTKARPSAREVLRCIQKVQQRPLGPRNTVNSKIQI